MSLSSFLIVNLKKTVYLLTVVVMVSAQNTTEMQSQCSTGFPPASSLQPLANLSELVPENRDGGGIQVIAPGMMFNCYGQITEWSALLTIDEAFAQLSHRIELQVWRPAASTNFDEKFDLVGSNTLQAFPTGRVTLGEENSTMTFFTISEAIDQDDQIYFEPGDILGWYSPQRFATLNPGFGVAFNSSSDTLFTTFTTEVLCEMYTCDDAVQQLSDVLPLITLEFEPENTLTANLPLSMACSSQPPPSCALTTTTQATAPATNPTIGSNLTIDRQSAAAIATTVILSFLLVVLIILFKAQECIQHTQRGKIHPGPILVKTV